MTCHLVLGSRVSTPPPPYPGMIHVVTSSITVRQNSITSIDLLPPGSGKCQASRTKTAWSAVFWVIGNLAASCKGKLAGPSPSRKDPIFQELELDKTAGPSPVLT